MTNIIKLANEAGIDEWWESGDENRSVFNAHLKRFADLLAKKWAGAEMPEPAILGIGPAGRIVEGYTPDQMREAIASALAKQSAVVAELKYDLDAEKSISGQAMRAVHETLAERDALKVELERLKKIEAAAKKVAEDVRDLVEASEGVEGMQSEWHCGDFVRWEHLFRDGDFEDWLKSIDELEDALKGQK